MTFQRTRNETIIRRIATHPKVWPMIADGLNPEAWNPVMHEGVWYVLIFEEVGSLPRGMFIFLPENSVCWRIHVCLLPEFWGGAARAMREVFQWLWGETNCCRITGSVPVWNGPAVHCALRAGMTPYGVNQHSSLKDSRLHHQLLFGISKPAERGAA